MVRETWVHSQVESYQRLKKWYLKPPCLTLRFIRYVSRVKWSNPGKGVVPFLTPHCSGYQKGSLWVTLDCGCQLFSSNFGLGLGCVDNFLNPGARTSTIVECFRMWMAILFEHMLWIKIILIFHWLFFFINRFHLYRWVGLVYWLNYLILAVDLIVVDRLLITQMKTKQTNPIPKNDESLMSSANSI